MNGWKICCIQSRFLASNNRKTNNKGQPWKMRADEKKEEKSPSPCSRWLLPHRQGRSPLLRKHAPPSVIGRETVCGACLACTEENFARPEDIKAKSVIHQPSAMKQWPLRCAIASLCLPLPSPSRPCTVFVKNRCLSSLQPFENAVFSQPQLVKSRHERGEY